MSVTVLHLPRLLGTQEPGDCRIDLVCWGKRIRHRTGQGAHGRPLSPLRPPQVVATSQIHAISEAAHIRPPQPKPLLSAGFATAGTPMPQLG